MTDYLMPDRFSNLLLTLLTFINYLSPAPGVFSAFEEMEG